MRLSPSFVALAVGASSFSSAFASPVPAAADAVPNSPALSNAGTPSGTPSVDSGAFPNSSGAAAQIDTTKFTNGNILQQTPQYHTDELAQRGLLSVTGSGSKPSSGTPNSGLGLGLIGLGGSNTGNPTGTVSGATNKVGLLGLGGATSGNPASSVSGATNKVGLLGLTNSKAST